MSTFNVGDRVRMTDAAIEHGLRGRHASRPTTGVVVGLCRSPLLIRVKLDDRKGVDSYHRDFWEHDPT